MDNPPKKLSLIEISEIPLEQLVDDRVLQRDIHYSVEKSTRDTNYVDEERPYNPNHIVTLKESGSLDWQQETHSFKSISYQHETFRIMDKIHIYFFDAGWPCAKVPEFLRPEDIIPSGTMDSPFNKPLNRVKEAGGMPELYNSKTQEWQEFGNQVYKPSLVQKAKVVLGIH